jgi:hypothetical protein
MVRVGCVFVLAGVVGCGGGSSGGQDAGKGDASGDRADAADRGADTLSVDRAGDTAPDASAPDVEGVDAVDAPGAETDDGPAGADGVDGTSDGDVGDAVDASDAVEAAEPVTVKVGFTGTVVTVASAPLGFDSTVRTKPVSGNFTYNLGYVDDTAAGDRGKFERFGKMSFTLAVDGHTITGSGKGILQTENLTSSDTFRYLDGKQPIDNGVRTMKFDGVDAPTLRLSIAISDDSATMLTSDELPAPFPAIQIKGALGITHTFAFTDDGGTLLIQLDTLANQ